MQDNHLHAAASLLPTCKCKTTWLRSEKYSCQAAAVGCIAQEAGKVASALILAAAELLHVLAGCALGMRGSLLPVCPLLHINSIYRL